MGIDLADVVQGNMAPSLVLAAIAGLPRGCKTHSMILADQHGGDWIDWVGRDQYWFVLADIYDALNVNTRATGEWKKGKAPDFPPYPRPGTKKKKMTLAGLHAMWAERGGPA